MTELSFLTIQTEYVFLILRPQLYFKPGKHTLEVCATFELLKLSDMTLLLFNIKKWKPYTDKSTFHLGAHMMEKGVGLIALLFETAPETKKYVTFLPDDPAHQMVTSGKVMFLGYRFVQ